MSRKYHFPLRDEVHLGEVQNGLKDNIFDLFLFSFITVIIIFLLQNSRFVHIFLQNCLELLYKKFSIRSYLPSKLFGNFLIQNSRFVHIFLQNFLGNCFVCSKIPSNYYYLSDGPVLPVDVNVEYDQAE